jgi:hypothetical protein
MNLKKHVRGLNAEPVYGGASIVMQIRGIEKEEYKLL